MYVTVRRYTGAGQQIGEIARRVQDGLVPRFKAMQGFKGYCAFGGEEGSAISVSVFDDRRSAMAANDAARAWVTENLRDLLPVPPEVSAGPCVLHGMAHERSQPAGQGAPLFVVVRQYEGIGPEQRIVELGQQHIVPLITNARGFRGYYVAIDEANRSQMSSVMLFASREEAMRATEQVLARVRETMRDVLPNPPRILAGQTAVLATAGMGPEAGRG